MTSTNINTTTDLRFHPTAEAKLISDDNSARLKALLAVLNAVKGESWTAECIIEMADYVYRGKS